MEDTANRAIAIVAVGAILPDAPNVAAFWENIKNGRYSITEVSPDRWDPSYYYDPDPSVPDKTYSKIGGWVYDHVWDPVKWHLPIPPRVADAMDQAQKWAIAATRQALEDYGYPQHALDSDRVAVILGNAMAGEKHYLTSLRVHFPEYAHELGGTSSFTALPQAIRNDIMRELHNRVGKHLPEVTEDTMPGELANCIAGRIANLYNLHGPNYICDAACASAMAAMTAAIEGLIQRDYDAVITGGIDRNMGAPTFVKFCKIGALSATGTRPFAEGADGFVMGEGAAIFLLKRLADAERDGDKIYAVIRGIGASSDGKGKGITAPNPVGQKFCLERAWKNAGLSPATATLIEGHGTSTRVGDVVEAQSLADMLNPHHLPVHSIALGSVKSNIGHLKGAAGAAGVLKTALALRDKVFPPSVNCEHPSPDIDFAHSPLFVNTELRPWQVPADGPRRAGISAFGFGGTNFHIVLEEHIPHRLTGNGKRRVSVPAVVAHTSTEASMSLASPAVPVSSAICKVPLRGALVIGGESDRALIERLRAVMKHAESGFAPEPSAPAESDLRAPERLAIDYADAMDLADKSSKALKALASNHSVVWKALRAQGIFRGRGPAGKVAFLYTGQGSQYVNMLRSLYAIEPIVAETFAEANRVMLPLLGKPLTEFVFVDETDPKAAAKAEEDLRQTAITQPTVLTIDLALTRLLAAYGIKPEMTMGHSLGEYGALVAAGAMRFENALEAVSARGRGMTQVAVADKGKMAAVFAPVSEIERILTTIGGYVVIANINSDHQAVIGGATDAVEHAIAVIQEIGYEVSELPVSHAFHTSIVAPASEPLHQELERQHLESPHLPIVANVNGEFYPTGPDVVPQMLDLLSQQVASPVQFVKGLHRLYDAGARVFVEVGPKKALQGFAEDVLGEHSDVVSLFTNHPKFGDVASFNQALCGLYASGLGLGTPDDECEKTVPLAASVSAESTPSEKPARAPAAVLAQSCLTPAISRTNGDHLAELGQLFADVHEKGWRISCHNGEHPSSSLSVVITGAALGLPGTEHIFDDSNLARLLAGDPFIDVIPTRLRKAMLEKHITRLVKSDNGGPSFETIHDMSDVIKLAGRGGKFDLEGEFGVSADRRAALDRTTQLAIAAGIDALRDAGIPLVMRYKTTSKATQLPDRWALADCLRDDTGVIFASAFPGCDSYADEMSRCYTDRSRREQLELLESLLARSTKANGDSALEQEIERRKEDLRDAIEKEPHSFDRRFLLRVLPMGHSQFAEFIGARGPNTQINSACASTTQAVALAEDWIREGRCRRVIVVSADDVTSDHNLEWFGAGFLASGAAATDEIVEQAATPFDRRRHGLILGMGAAALVIESADAARERGIQPICAVLSTVTANSAFHATRLDVQHIAEMMEMLISQAERHHGISRSHIAPHTVFVSHETYTPARGGSASAEINALRRVFGGAADQIVIANTKGFTGHAMATGIEDVLAVKSLETGVVPPVANFKEVDPELGVLNLSKGGIYPVEYALRLGAGFGSQISMSLLHWVATKDGVRRRPNALGYAYRIIDEKAWTAWLSKVCGHERADLEVVHRTLRVRDQGAVMPSIAAKPKSELVMDEPPVPITPAAPFARIATDSKEGASERQLIGDSPKSQITVDPVTERVLALVSQKTGYPIDMLDPDLDLEADLGVDTVKQAEVMATIREAYGISRDDQLRLRDFPTLSHVIRFVHERKPDLVMQPSQTAAPVALRPAGKEEQQMNATLPGPSSTEPGWNDPVKDRILDLMVEKTGYPRDMLDLDLDLEADLGIDTVKQAEMFATIREIYKIPRDESRKLRDYPTLAHVIRFVHEKRPELARANSERVPAQAPMSPTSVSVAAPALAPTPSAVNADAIEKKVLQIVTEKTGYPEEMLDLDLDLEADLGIDTVKQAEMFAAVRALYNIPRDENLKLRDFPTLAHVIRFAQDRAAALPPAASPAAKHDISGPKPPASVSSAVRYITRPVPASFEAANQIPRRVPLPILRPPLAFCKTTNVRLRRNSRVILMPDQSGVAEALTNRLQTLGIEVLHIEPSCSAEVLSEAIGNWAAAGRIDGVYWLPALDNEGVLSTLDISQWHEALNLRVKSLYLTMRTLYEHVVKSSTFLISATRLGGQHGYGQTGAAAPLGGAVTGFAKAYKRERMECLVKTVDFESGRNAAEIAQLLIDETLRDPGALEIGYRGEQRWTIGLSEKPAVNDQPGMVLNEKSVFLITGAAGSIVSAITADLASASGGTFYLLDLVPEPNPNNPDLKNVVSDREGLKRELFQRIQARGQRATPALLEKELASLERAQAAQSAIDAVRAAGGTAHYLSVNITDAEAVARVIEQVRNTSGRIDVLLHAAGMERSHLLPDKNPEEFDLVFNVKADGFFNLLCAIGDMPLAACMVFSSIAGRFGNAGQTDYSAANDLLCKITSSLRSTRPETRAIAIDWTAWSGIGMATRGSIPKMMALAGIDMLTPAAGIPVVRRELTIGSTRGEVVIAERLGVLLHEFDKDGGLAESAESLRNTLSKGPMLGMFASISCYDGYSIETILDPKLQPFLHDHQIDGTPVLPGVMGLEAFAEASLCLLPGWHVESMEDIGFLAPFKFYRGEPRVVRIETQVHPHGDHLLAECRLIGERSLASRSDPQRSVHFTARLHLAKDRCLKLGAKTFIRPSGNTVDAAEIYRFYFHGPAYQVLEKAWWDGKYIIGLLAQGLPPNHHPADLTTIVAPRLIELCLQSAGVWELAVQGRMALPRHIQQISLVPQTKYPEGRLYAVVVPKPAENSFGAEVLDEKGNCYLSLNGYQTVALSDVVDPQRLGKLQATLSGEAVAA